MSVTRILGMFLLAGAAALNVALDVAVAAPRHELYRAQMAAAEAHERLDATPASERGFEWRAHDAAMDESLLTWRIEGGSPTCLAVAPDGARIAVGTVDGALVVLDAATGAELARVAAHEQALTDVKFDAKGLRLATCSFDRRAKVWDAVALAPIAQFTGHDFPIGGVVLAPDLSWAASSSYRRPEGTVEGIVHVWNPADGAQLATASADGTVRMWSVDGWTERALLRGHADDVEEVAFSPDGARLWSVSQDGTLRAWDARTPWHGGVRFETSAAAYVARFNRQGTALAIATFDGRVEIRDARTWERVISWQAHDAAKSCHALDWTPDGTRIVTGSHDATVRVFNAADGSELAVLSHDASITWLRVSPDGGLVAVASGAAITVTDLATGQRLHEFPGHSKAVLSVAFSPDSRSCVSAGRDGKARVWNARTGEAALEIDASSEDVADALFSRDGRQLAVVGRNGRVRLHDARSGAVVRDLFTGRHGVSHAAWSPDGSRLALASDAIRILDVTDGGQVGEFRPHRGGPYHVDFDPSGERLASASTDGAVAITDSVPLRRRGP